ncbi:MAG: polyamine aminopropyltransferase [Methylocystaceae bacterium]
MELWVTEEQTPDMRLSLKSSGTLRMEDTNFQHLAVVETNQYGRMLLLDGLVMTTEADEFVYHEMITQIALNSHPNPERVLIIGGGDGGALREVVKHPAVKEGYLVEIDDRVIQASRDFFPTLNESFDNPKAQVMVEDGLKFIKEHVDYFDVILIDSSEPMGPGEELFEAPFYRNVYRALKVDGMMVAQTESPFVNQEVIRKSFKGIASVFPITKLYMASIPTYPSGLWTFTAGSKEYDPEIPIRTDMAVHHKYYNASVHEGCFKLPSFVARLTEQE